MLSHCEFQPIGSNERLLWKFFVCYTFVMTAAKNSQVDAFIAGLPSWQQEICIVARRLIHEAEPEIEETIKRGSRPYFILNGNICAFMAAKDHINIFIYDPIAPDPQYIINQ